MDHGDISLAHVNKARCDLLVCVGSQSSIMQCLLSVNILPGKHNTPEAAFLEQCCPNLLEVFMATRSWTSSIISKKLFSELWALKYKKKGLFHFCNDLYKIFHK